MSESKLFHLGDILSITTDKLVSPRLMGGVYDILNFMTGESLFTHQLPRASRWCAPELLKQHPQLAAVNGDACPQTPDGTQAWLAEQVATYGEQLLVHPAPHAYEARNPIDELTDMIGSDRVIVAKA